MGQFPARSHPEVYSWDFMLSFRWGWSFLSGNAGFGVVPHFSDSLGKWDKGDGMT